MKLLLIESGEVGVWTLSDSECSFVPVALADLRLVIVFVGVFSEVGECEVLRLELSDCEGSSEMLCEWTFVRVRLRSLPRTIVIEMVGVTVTVAEADELTVIVLVTVGVLVPVASNVVDGDGNSVAVSLLMLDWVGVISEDADLENEIVVEIVLVGDMRLLERVDVASDDRLCEMDTRLREVARDTLVVRFPVSVGVPLCQYDKERSERVLDVDVDSVSVVVFEMEKEYVNVIDSVSEGDISLCVR